MLRVCLIIFMLCTGWLYAQEQTENFFAEPKPSISNPRKIIFGISDGDTKEINNILSVTNNVMKVYGPENVTFIIVAYNNGIKTLLKSEQDIRRRVEALQMYDVDFVACLNTLETKKISQTELIDGIRYVQAGVAEMVERVKEGYVYIRP
mgnify:CR=1 FL=1